MAGGSDAIIAFVCILSHSSMLRACRSGPTVLRLFSLLRRRLACSIRLMGLYVAKFFHIVSVNAVASGGGSAAAEYVFVFVPQLQATSLPLWSDSRGFG